MTSHSGNLLYLYSRYFQHLNMQRRIFLIFLSIITTLVVQAAVSHNTTDTTQYAVKDSLRISLITCEPGPEIYELFGHSAIRVVQTGENPFDWVFNYGMFSFTSDNFIYKFVKGETDYLLGVYDFDDFMIDYVLRGSSVYQQEINLTTTEKQKLLQLLIDNTAPQNRVYRYNFIFDNCATRPRNKIEEAIDGYIDYGEAISATTFRKQIHYYGSNYSWLMLGIDLALGERIDRKNSWREQMFIPMTLQEAYRQATIHPNDSSLSQRKLVAHEEFLYKSEESPVFPPTAWYLSPIFCFLILLLCTSYLTYHDIKNNRVSHWFDATVFGINFLASIIIYFLIFVSEHPATTININALWITPFSIMAIIAPINTTTRKAALWYHQFNIAAIALTIILSSIQHLNIAIYPILVIYAIRSINYIKVIKKRYTKRNE